MLKILVRLYLIVLIIAIISIVFVRFGFPYVFTADFKVQMHRDFANEALLLREYLGPVQDNAQQAKLNRMDQLNPGRYERLSNEKVMALSSATKKELAHYQIVWTGTGENGDNHTDVYMALQDGSILVIHPQPSTYLEAIAYILVFSTMLMAMVIWLRPHWRDLEELRIAAASFGGGALDARAKLSEYSSIKQLHAYFNNMAERISTLITAQREMVNAASHELRTPLARLEFGLANLMDTTTGSHTHARIQAMRQDVKELEILVGELLTLSMLEQSSMSERTVKVVLEDFLHTAAGVSDDELASRRCNIVWSIDPSISEVVTEPRSLARAFSNLIQNALRYTRSTIQVRVESDAEFWYLIVEDDGVGIPEQERERIFEPFYRLDRSRDRATGGYGLGLAIVKKIVERLGGQIRVDTSDLGGAAFKLNFPHRSH